MEWDISKLDNILAAYALALPRMYLIFTILPVMSKQVLGGAMVRNGILLSLSLFVFPINHGSLEMELDRVDYFILLLKETVIGLLIGMLVSIPFWIAEGVGFFVDNQRGASMASSINPLLGGESSPLGIFLTQLLNTFFIVSGTFMLMLSVIYQSYVHWPVGTVVPVAFEGFDLYLLSQLDYLMRTILLFAAPMAAAMFLVEFTLALVSRFAPQLNVFFMAMPIKSAVAIFVLIIYVGILVENIDELVIDILMNISSFMEGRLNI